MSRVSDESLPIIVNLCTTEVSYKLTLFIGIRSRQWMLRLTEWQSQRQCASSIWRGHSPAILRHEVHHEILVNIQQESIKVHKKHSFDTNRN